MASAIGTALISTILPPMAAKARDIIKDKGKAIVRSMADKAMDNIERDISRLQKTLRMIQSIVRVAEEKQIDDVYIRNWLRDLVDIAYKARDVLDDFITFSSCVITAYEEASNAVNFISSSDTSNIPLTVLNRLPKDIRSVSERFDEKIKEAKAFAKDSKRVRVEPRPEVGPFINKQRDGLFLGRKKVQEEIMDKILHPSGDRVDVVVIWGMGGIGKTTLAQSIYNDESVKKVPRRWLCVGESKFSAEKVIREIVNDKQTIGIVNLQTTLLKELSGDRFLIVLDDVWDVDGKEWNLLFDPLTNVGKGGMIIITRREKEVCPALINIQTAHNLEPLSEEDSWLIFESCAYVNGKSDSTPDLKHIGEEIVKKLNGHPLALKVVGRSLLHKDYSTWKKFLESKLTKDDEVMSALRWSYNHLPRHLKVCFTYCALFPKDHVFDNEKVLVEMWMAHDLIQKEEPERPEYVGAQYYKELVNASLLQSRDDGKYVMHDLIHVLALLVSNGEFATANSSLTNDQMENVRHITITRDDYSKVPRLCKMEKLLTLYTIWSYENSRKDSALDDVFNQLKSIRVLVLVSWEITYIPDCISELRHLRYLDVSKTGVRRLPDSLCDLYNLQTLATYMGKLALPKYIVNISSLRCVRASLSTCKGVGKLTSLQELSSIHVCEGDNIRELGDMQRLRGKLRIEGLENVTSKEDAAGALMEKQTLIDELELVFNQHLQKSTISAQVLDGLGCPPNLTYLQIDGYTGVKSPSWMVDGTHKFDKLQTLTLYNCPKLESLPPLGELTSLKYLSLRNVGVKRLGDEFYGKFTDGKVFFPSLESLQFYDMKEWEEWDDIIIENSGVSFFPRLTTLKIDCCAKLVSILPVVENPIMNAANFRKSLSRFEIRDCDGLKRLQLDALVSLKELKISNCSSLVQITSAICESLEISSCRLLEKMDVARRDSLVVIKILKLKDCESLRSLSIDIHGMDSLEDLTIHGSPTLELAFEDGSSSSSSSGNSVAVPLHYISTNSTQVFRTLLHHELMSLEYLGITNLGGFENFDETEAKNFCKLRSLKILSISQCEDLMSLPPDFHKLSSLKSLSINHCPQLQSLPPDLHKLSSLEELKINRCPQLQSLPLGELTSLKYLYLRNVGVKRLGDEFYGKFTDSKVFFPSLESLYFSNMNEWEEWDDFIIENSSVSFFPRLTTLEINDCAKLLSVLPVFENLIMNAANFRKSLSRLEIHDCDGLKRLQLDALVSLKELDICNCDGLKRLQLDALVSLKELKISNCSSLVQITSVICESLEISSCRLLEKMDVARCDSLVVIKILKLEVEDCESLRSLSIDIHGMDSLEYLHITGCPKLELAFEDGSSSSSSSGNSVAVPIHDIFTDSTQVFRTLLHHELVSLKYLGITNLGGFENFDETEANNFCKLRSLKGLYISQCEDLMSLPPDFHKLSSLKSLSINHCPQLQSFPADWHFMTSLSRLEISNCSRLLENLVQITSAICESLEISSCRLLEKMDVARCDSLVVIKILKLEVEDCESFRSLSIDIPGLDSLEDLRINGCPTQELAFEDGSSSSSSLGNSVAVPIHGISTNSTQVFRTLLHHELVSLKYLDITNLEGFENFDETEANNFCKLRSLKSLEIRRCKDLMSLPPNFHMLSSLEELDINNCSQLQSLPHNFHMLSSLNSLTITSCPKLQSLPPDFHKLSSLERLYINSCPQFQSLPPDFHKLSSLNSLTIISCPKLQSLPPDFHKLSSLRSLSIYICPQLRSLPANGLPPSLSYLSIISCRLLYERCKDESGLDWHKINHLRKRNIRLDW